jgi:predicted RNA-binding protein YlqC (UPF0109 family)
VDNPDRVQVRAVEGEEVTVLELRVTQRRGRVIGRKWPELQLDAAILAAAGMKLRKQIALEVLER